MKKRYIFSNIIITLTLVCLCVLSLSFTGATTVFNNTKNKPIYQGNSNTDKVSLMINVYWGTEFLDGMLNVLDKYNAKCTFFVGGSWASENNAMLKKIIDRGHEIGNHGFNHKDHKKISSAQNKDEITMCESVVEKISGVKTILFAPPSGAFNDTTMKICEELGYKVIMWSKDTIDWRDKDADLIYKRATNKVSAGDLILMHPTKATLDALPRILDTYKQLGLIASTVTTTIS